MPYNATFDGGPMHDEMQVMPDDKPRQEVLVPLRGSDVVGVYALVAVHASAGRAHHLAGYTWRGNAGDSRG